MTSMRAVGLVLVSTVFTALGQVFFKMGSGRLALSLSGVLFNYMLLVGFFFYGIGALMLIVSLRHGELSVLYPVYAMNFVWVSLLADRFLGESMSSLKWGGILVIMMGVSLIGWGGRR